MKTKSKWIICLLAIAVTLFCTILFYAIPEKQARMEKYTKNQTDALTHDISSIEEYRNQYLGDASNTTGLINSLPLNNISKTFAIDEDTLTVNYQDNTEQIGIEKLQRNLIYNSIAAMGAIENLGEIQYTFNDNTYVFSREEVEGICTEYFHQENLSKLLIKSTWEKTVQQEVKNPNFVHQFSAFADSADN